MSRSKNRKIADLISGGTFDDGVVAASEVTGLHTVAVSGNYNELENRVTDNNQLANSSGFITVSEVPVVDATAITEGDTSVTVLDSGTDGKVVVRVNDNNTLEINAGAIVVPNGTTAQRDPNAAVGSFRYNTTAGFFETLTPSGWGFISAPPSISSISPSNFSGAPNQSFTVNGSFFDANSTVVFKGSDGTEYPTGTLTFVSGNQLLITNSTFLPAANEPFRVAVTNGAGLTATSSQGIDAGSVPAFTTAAGNLATNKWNQALNTSVLATDAETSVTGYTLSQGALPSGLSLNTSTGAITGTPTEQATTTYTFTVEATDTVGNTNTRQFNIQILNSPPVWSSPEPNSVIEGNIGSSYNIPLSATDPETSSVSFSTSNLPAGLSLSGNSITGTPSAGGNVLVAVSASDGFGTSVNNFYINSSTSFYPFTSHVFTSGNVNNVRTGDDYSTFNTAYSSQGFANDTSFFNVTTLGYQDWVVPDDGSYRIIVKGASGGLHYIRQSSGAVLTGDYTFTQGQAIRMIVGKEAEAQEDDADKSTSGGGGSFVLFGSSITAFANSNSYASSNILIAAGGGGGSTRYGAGGNGNLNSTSGGTAPDGSHSITGTNGNGSPIATYGNYSAGGGAGLLSNGSLYRYGGTLSGDVARSYSSGFNGAEVVTSQPYQTGHGAFGGGATGTWPAGGGGGYSGGAGDHSDGSGSDKYGGGGGGCYMNTSHAAFTSEHGGRSLNVGAGSVTIQKL